MFVISEFLFTKFNAWWNLFDFHFSKFELLLDLVKVGGFAAEILDLSFICDQFKIWAQRSAIVVLFEAVKESFIIESNDLDLQSNTSFAIAKYAAVSNITTKIDFFNSKFGFRSTSSKKAFVVPIFTMLNYSIKASAITFQSAGSSFR